MRRISSFFAVLILLASAAPLLACMTGRAMSHEESACCRSMHGKCGGMEKMGCCRTEVRTDAQPQLAVATPAIRVHFAEVAWLGPANTGMRGILSSSFRMPNEHAPPGLTGARITVLRI